MSYPLGALKKRIIVADDCLYQNGLFGLFFRHPPRSIRSNRHPSKLKATNGRLSGDKAFPGSPALRISKAAGRKEGFVQITLARTFPVRFFGAAPQCKKAGGNFRQLVS
jgi:hypothetical protein